MGRELRHIGLKVSTYYHNKDFGHSNFSLSVDYNAILILSTANNQGSIRC